MAKTRSKSLNQFAPISLNTGQRTPLNSPNLSIRAAFRHLKITEKTTKYTNFLQRIQIPHKKCERSLVFCKFTRINDALHKLADQLQLTDAGNV